MKDNYVDRFWRKVDREKSNIFYNNTRCWEWIAGCYENGYGAYGNLKAHRVSYEIEFGDIPNGLFVLHHCDNRKCVNPSHLFLGTNQDNVNDMVSKGRHASGENVVNSKLTDGQVDEIRKRYKRRSFSGDNSYDLADEFGVSHALISMIVNYKRRK